MNMDELFVRLMGDHQVGVERARFVRGANLREFVVVWAVEINIFPRR